jgi:hypothetical protein
LSKKVFVTGVKSNKSCGGGPRRLIMRAIWGSADFQRPPLLSLKRFVP